MFSTAKVQFIFENVKCCSAIFALCLVNKWTKPKRGEECMSVILFAPYGCYGYVRNK